MSQAERSALRLENDRKNQDRMQEKVEEKVDKRIYGVTKWL
jgi:hypothetical protein